MGTSEKRGGRGKGVLYSPFERPAPQIGDLLAELRRLLLRVGEQDSERVRRLGRMLGSLAGGRPDVIHQLLVGIQEGLIGSIPGFHGYGFDAILELLEGMLLEVREFSKPGEGTFSALPLERFRSPSGTGKA